MDSFDIEAKILAPGVLDYDPLDAIERGGKISELESYSQTQARLAVALTEESERHGCHRLIVEALALWRHIPHLSTRIETGKRMALSLLGSRRVAWARTSCASLLGDLRRLPSDADCLEAKAQCLVAVAASMQQRAARSGDADRNLNREGRKMAAHAGRIATRLDDCTLLMEVIRQFFECIGHVTVVSLLLEYLNRQTLAPLGFMLTVNKHQEILAETAKRDKEALAAISADVLDIQACVEATTRSACLPGPFAAYPSPI